MEGMHFLKNKLTEYYKICFSKEHFSSEGYLLQNPDVAKSGMNPWIHYVKYGKKEGRGNGLIPPEDEFSPEGYLLQNPDVAESGMDPWIHYVKYGKKEGRFIGILKKYSNILRFKDFIRECESFGIIYGRELLENMNVQNRVLLISHELSLTGAPVALFRLARYLKQNGMSPLVMAPKDGSFCKEIWQAGIPVIIYEYNNLQGLVKCSAHLFSMVIVNTANRGPFIRKLSGLSVPVLWWIHEAEALYVQSKLDEMPDTVQGNIHVYCAGSYAEKMLLKYRPAYHTEELLYYQPDYVKYDCVGENIIPPQAIGKTVFMAVGTIEPRKGQDILIQAVQRLPYDKLQKCFFLFVGHVLNQPILTAIQQLQKEYPQHVCYLGEVEMKQMPALYRQMNCLICASRDDPMPIVVAEALSLSKLVICSANTGSAALLEENRAGLVYRNNDVDELVQSILKVLDQGEELDIMKKAARETYEKYFSQATFDRAVTRVLKEILSNGDNGSQ